MAPIKFEENIREKLQERELQPSKDAWSKLESRLGNELPEKKGNRGIWLAIAASMTGILIIVSFFFFGLNGEQLTELVIDEINTPDLEEVKSDNFTSEDELQNIQLEEVATTEAETEGTKDSEKDNLQKAVDNMLIAVEKNTGDKANELAVSNSEEKITRDIVVEIDEGVAKVQNETPKTTNVEIISPKKEDVFVDAKVDEVVASIQNMEKENNTVTAEEIDDLLIKAQRELATQRILNSSTKKIDATALLRDVETEMERSFRDKVFDALGNGYNKIRTAVAQRNN